MYEIKCEVCEVVLGTSTSSKVSGYFCETHDPKFKNKYALVKDTIVIDIVNEYPDTIEAVKTANSADEAVLITNQIVNIGWEYTNGEFTNPNAQPENI